MGLDMYLSFQKKGLPEDEYGDSDGESTELAYWRKHPNLHGYIVENFANGVDECQEIRLTLENLLQIQDAIRKEELPETTGFFFGTSYVDEEQRTEDIDKIERGVVFLLSDAAAMNEHEVVYQASW